MTTSTLVRRVATAAALIAVGNIASRLLGMVRGIVIAGLFGRGAEVAAFQAASTIPTTLYDLLINGAISAALVPVFSTYSERDEAEFWRVASSIINLALLVLSGMAALLAWQAEPAVTLLAGGFSGATRELTVQMVRLMLPAVVLMGLSGLITALLYARQKFLLPAFTTSAFNLGIILAAVLLEPLIGPLALVVGVLCGALLQVLLQLPGLRGASYTPTIALRHPAVRQILRLYAPVALGIGFSTLGTVLDRNLASRLGESAIPTMAYATTLIQFPLGLVAAAVSFAVLPTLSRQSDAGDETAFRRTLAMGINVVLLLVLPAAFALAALAQPIVTLVFQRGAFTAEDSHFTAAALLLYLPGLPAAAVDQMLLFAFYARQKTLTPNLVQGGAILIYAAVALTLLRLSALGVGALVIANSAQWIGHMLLLLLLSRQIVDLRGLGIGRTAASCGAAGLALLATSYAVQRALPLPPLASLLLAGGAGALVYLGICLALRVEALAFFTRVMRARLTHR